MVCKVERDDCKIRVEFVYRVEKEKVAFGSEVDREKEITSGTHLSADGYRGSDLTRTGAVGPTVDGDVWLDDREERRFHVVPVMKVRVRLVGARDR